MAKQVLLTELFMDFDSFWQTLPLKLKPDAKIKNWTAAKGYLGNEFTVLSVSDTMVEVDPPKANDRQRVSRQDFEVTFDNWDTYCSGQLPRQELVQLTRNSKYTISIIKHLEASER